MTWSSAGSAATWPLYVPAMAPGLSSTLTFRANTDAGLCFLVGTYTFSGGASAGYVLNPGDKLPAVFRPQQAIQLTSASGAAVTVGTDGSLTTVSNSVSGGLFRVFYFTTVTPA